MPPPIATEPGTISSNIVPVLSRRGWDLLVQWEPFGSGGHYQLYQDRKLVYFGDKPECVLPWPTRRCQFDVLGVESVARSADYSADLPAADLGRPVLTWTGGKSLGSDLAGYRIYRSATAGGAVDYSAPVATVPLSDDGTDRTGWGLGGWSEGSWGTASVHHTWTGDTLPAGDWSFGVAAYDSAGNEVATPSEVTVTLGTNPRPPAADPATGARLSLSYNSGTRVPTLTWLASPDA